jgi:predicted permease
MPDVLRLLPRQTLDVVPAGAGVAVMKEQYSRSLQILMAVCGMVLLIACANVANLMLARGMAKRQQTALRLAMGAPRRQIVLQALVESVLLSVGGAIAGLFVAVAAARLLVSLAFQSATVIPISTTPSLPVLGFAAALALVTGLVFGVAPAWFATRTDPIDALRGSGRTTGDHGAITRQVLLVVQAAVSVVLIAGAAMLARSLGNLQHQDFGYEIKGRVAVSMNRLPSTYPLQQLTAVYRAMEERMNRLPGVRGSGLALYNPLTDNWGELIVIDGKPLPKMSEEAGASWDRVSANYLQNLGVRVVRGRGFTEADNEHSELVAVVNQAFVRRFFKAEEDPIDRFFGIDLPENAHTWRIVGVVADAKFAGFALDKPARPMFYVPLAQNVEYKHELLAKIERMTHFAGGALLVTDLEPGAVEPMLTKAFAEIDPNLTITDVRKMEQVVARSFEQERAVASLAGTFGIVALLLAAVGLYGVTAYSVTRRTNEIGIRMALGADRSRVLRLVLRSAFARVVVGLVLGVPLAIGAGQLISAQLYGVSSWDPVALGVAAAALAVSAFIAAVIPANRAASIAPMQALRTE